MEIFTTSIWFLPPIEQGHRKKEMRDGREQLRTPREASGGDAPGSLTRGALGIPTAVLQGNGVVDNAITVTDWADGGSWWLRFRGEIDRAN